MLNIKRKILVTTWTKGEPLDLNAVIRTYGKVNPVKMIRNGYYLASQELVEYVLSEEEFALAAQAKKGDQ